MISDPLRPSGLGSGPTPTDWHRLGRRLAQQTDGSGNPVLAPHEALTSHIAVTNHGKGVGSDNLANFVACWADFAGARIRGTGHLQYDNEGRQRFEDLEGTQLCDELLDELLDVVNYTAMVAIKVLAIRGELQERP